MKYYLIEVRLEVAVTPVEMSEDVEPDVGKYMLPETIVATGVMILPVIPHMATVTFNTNPEQKLMVPIKSHIERS